MLLTRDLLERVSLCPVGVVVLCLCPYAVGSFDALTVVDPQRCRPNCLAIDLRVESFKIFRFVFCKLLLYHTFKGKSVSRIP